MGKTIWIGLVLCLGLFSIWGEGAAHCLESFKPDWAWAECLWGTYPLAKSMLKASPGSKGWGRKRSCLGRSLQSQSHGIAPSPNCKALVLPPARLVFPNCLQTQGLHREQNTSLNQPLCMERNMSNSSSIFQASQHAPLLPLTIYFKVWYTLV